MRVSVWFADVLSELLFDGLIIVGTLFLFSQTVAVVFKQIFAKKFPNFGFDVINLLFGFDEAEKETKVQNDYVNFQF